MSKKVVCTDPKNYNLTRGKEYEVEIDPNNENRYCLRNDRNLDSRYGTNMFEDVIEEPPVVRLDLNGIVNSVTYNGDNFTFQVNEGENLTVNTLAGMTLSNGRTNISCGIREMTGITNYSTIRQIILNCLRANDLELTNIELIALSNKIYSLKIQYLFNNSETGAIIASTNTNCVNFEEIDEVLSTFDVTSTRVNNPNSNNEIIIYIFNMGVEFAEQVEEIEEHLDF